MTLPTGNRKSNAPATPAAAVTLVELLLVMALLMIVVSVSVPSLSAFFRGRVLDSEGRRLLSLTRHAQSRAVSEGSPVLLWFDPEAKKYGVEEEPGYTEKDPKAVQFQLDPELQMEEVREIRVRPPASTAVQAVKKTVQADSTRKGLPEIRFLPDGFVDPQSPSAIRLWDRTGASLFLARGTNRFSYELRNTYQRGETER